MTFNKNEAGNLLPKVFTFNEKDAKVRIQVIDNAPYFIVKDLCEILEHSNHKVAVKGLDEDEVRKVYLTDSLGRKQETLAVNESGFYALVIRSNKPIGKKLRKWVTSEVLPSLRKTGRYELSSYAKQPKRKVGRRMSRGELVNAELLNLLWLIGESLNYGDQKDIALQLGVSVQTVNRTLNGFSRSNRVLSALYRRALENRQQFLLYAEPSVMAEQLRLPSAKRGQALIDSETRGRGQRRGIASASPRKDEKGKKGGAK